MAVHRVDRALATRAPEHLPDAETHGCGHAVGSAGRDSDGIGEEDRLRVQDQGQLVIGPQGIDLGQVGEIEGTFFQAGEVGDHLQPVHHRVHVEVGLVEAAAVAIAFRPCEPGRLGRGNTGVEVDAAQRDEAIGFPHHLDVAGRFPKANRETDDRIDAATAYRARRVVGVLLVAEVADAGAADADGQDAAPADVGDRVGKLAGAGGGPRRERLG